MLAILKNLFTNFNGDYVLIIYPFEQIKYVAVLFIYLSIPLNPLMANQSGDYLAINMLIKSCYKDIKSCNKALSKIHYYQKIAATNKKFSCQTRLLGLEANLIMAMNYNYKKKEAKTIIDSIKKYC